MSFLYECKCESTLAGLEGIKEHAQRCGFAKQDGVIQALLTSAQGRASDGAAAGGMTAPPAPGAPPASEQCKHCGITVKLSAKPATLAKHREGRCRPKASSSSAIADEGDDQPVPAPAQTATGVTKQVVTVSQQAATLDKLLLVMGVLTPEVAARLVPFVVHETPVLTSISAVWRVIAMMFEFKDAAGTVKVTGDALNGTWERLRDAAKDAIELLGNAQAEQAPARRTKKRKEFHDHPFDTNNESDSDSELEESGDDDDDTNRRPSKAHRPLRQEDAYDYGRRPRSPPKEEDHSRTAGPHGAGLVTAKMGKIFTLEGAGSEITFLLKATPPASVFLPTYLARLYDTRALVAQSSRDMWLNDALNWSNSSTVPYSFAFPDKVRKHLEDGVLGDILDWWPHPRPTAAALANPSLHEIKAAYINMVAARHAAYGDLAQSPFKPLEESIRSTDALREWYEKAHNEATALGHPTDACTRLACAWVRTRLHAIFTEWEKRVKEKLETLVRTTRRDAAASSVKPEAGMLTNHINFLACEPASIIDIARTVEDSVRISPSIPLPARPDVRWQGGAWGHSSAAAGAGGPVGGGRSQPPPPSRVNSRVSRDDALHAVTREAVGGQSVVRSPGSIVAPSKAGSSVVKPTATNPRSKATPTVSTAGDDSDGGSDDTGGATAARAPVKERPQFRVGDKMPQAAADARAHYNAHHGRYMETAETFGIDTWGVEGKQICVIPIIRGVACTREGCNRWHNDHNNLSTFAAPPAEPAMKRQRQSGGTATGGKADA